MTMMFKIKALMMVMFQWHAGNVACKVLMMIRTGGYILSSLMLIVLSVDRFLLSLSLSLSSLLTYNWKMQLLLVKERDRGVSQNLSPNSAATVLQHILVAFHTKHEAYRDEYSIFFL